MSRNLTFPFHVGPLGQPRTSGRGANIRQQLEQVLFTIPGERVGRPDFGAGIQRFVFEKLSAELLAATEYQLTSTLRDHMQDVIVVEGVRLTAEDSTLFVDILYSLRDTGEEQAASFTIPREGTP